MKKLIAILVVFFFAGTSFAQGVEGTAHDFSGETWSDGEICLPCHTPHNAKVSGAPLWNHASTIATYTLYSNTTDATMGQPTGSARLCLSCHDGTVALDSFGDATGTTFLTGTDSGFLDNDLSNDHPVSFEYNTGIANADGELFDPSTDLTSLGGTIDNDLLFAGQMQCASCHDVHNAHGNDFLLRIDNAGSALCITCHDKK